MDAPRMREFPPSSTRSNARYSSSKLEKNEKSKRKSSGELTKWGRANHIVYDISSSKLRLSLLFYYLCFLSRVIWLTLLAL